MQCRLPLCVSCTSHALCRERPLFTRHKTCSPSPLGSSPTTPVERSLFTRHKTCSPSPFGSSPTTPVKRCPSLEEPTTPPPTVIRASRTQHTTCRPKHWTVSPSKAETTCVSAALRGAPARQVLHKRLLKEWTETGKADLINGRIKQWIWRAFPS